MLLESSLANEVWPLMFQVAVPYLSELETCFLEFLEFEGIVGHTISAAAGGGGGWRRLRREDWFISCCSN